MYLKTEEEYKFWAEQQEQGAIGGGFLPKVVLKIMWVQYLQFVQFYILKRALVMICEKRLPNALMIIKLMPKTI